jgi:superfamily II DNA or RNA helicase
LINARASKSLIDAVQQVGRILRPKDEGENPYVIDFYDYNPKVKEWNHDARKWNEIHTKKKDQKPMKVDYFQRYAKRKIKAYQSEPEFELTVVNDVDEIFKER